MKKEDLRKVKISKHHDGSGDHVTNGYFHEWATYPYISDSGTVVPETYAIIEIEKDGLVRNIQPNRLKFVDDF